MEVGSIPTSPNWKSGVLDPDKATLGQAIVVISRGPVLTRELVLGGPMDHCHIPAQTSDLILVRLSLPKKSWSVKAMI